MSAFEDRQFENACEVPDGKIRVGSYFNFKDDTLKQRRQVSWIWHNSKKTSILIDHAPEFTPVANHSRFHYGRMEIIVHQY